MSSIDEQPAPKSTDRAPVWPMVIAYVETNYHDDGNDDIGQTVSKLVSDMRARHELGIKRYGVPLTAGNGRDAMIDAYQELLDFVVYTRAWLDERGLDVIRPQVAAKSTAAADINERGELSIDARDLMLDPIERVMVNLFSAATEALLQLRGMLTYRGAP